MFGLKLRKKERPEAAGGIEGGYRESARPPAPPAVPLRALGFVGGRPSPLLCLVGAASIGGLALDPGAALDGRIAERTLLFFVLPVSALLAWFLLLVASSLRLVTFNGLDGYLARLTRRKRIRAVVVGTIIHDMAKVRLEIAGRR